MPDDYVSKQLYLPDSPVLYARKSHELALTEDGGVFRSDDLELTLHAIAPGAKPRLAAAR